MEGLDRKQSTYCQPTVQPGPSTIYGSFCSIIRAVATSLPSGASQLHCIELDESQNRLVRFSLHSLERELRKQWCRDSSFGASQVGCVSGWDAALGFEVKQKLTSMAQTAATANGRAPCRVASLSGHLFMGMGW